MLSLKYQLAFLFLFLFTCAYAQTDHWESVILPGDEVRYLIPTAELSTSWITQGYNDGSWSTGATGIGYGDNDDETVIATSTTSVYLRRNFTIFDLAAVEEVLLHMDYDDGFVAYINGQEIARAFISNNPPAFNQLADDLHEALLYQGQTPEGFIVNPSILIEGENVLAVQVHNQSTTSSDLSALPVLSLGINNSSNDYFPTPDWFETPVNFTSSNLPVVFIDTEGGAEIPDEPKIWAQMKIVYRGDGERTFLTDADNEEYIDFNNQIRIEIRGSSSQALPKKQYGFTTYDEAGEKDNVKLLGMPKENDWILNGLAFDPSLMRDYVAYNVSRQIGEYASRTQYCEVILNGVYNGLYILQEKLKKDDNRINITAVGDNEDGNITGGYITKADRVDESDPLAWSMPSYSGGQTNFIHEEPKPDEVTAEQGTYIQEEFEKLQSTTDALNASIVDGYPSVIDIPSFINFMLLNELASNVDAYQLSTYFHKDKNGKLRAGPIWDFNLTFGNDLFQWDFDRSHTDVWQFEYENTGAKFWKDLFNNADFRCYLAKRWNELSAAGQPLSYDHLVAFIEDTEQLIGEAAVREQQTWNSVANHDANVESMKVWIAERIEWMNANIGSFSSCDGVSTPELVISKINYHPFSEDFGDIDEQEFIEITNASDNVVDLTGLYFGGTGFVYQFPEGSVLKGGESLALAKDIDTYIARYKKAPFGEFTRKLSNSSETLILLDAFGNVIDEVTYVDEAPWPELADGDGYLLQLNDVLLDNDDPLNWSAVIDASVNSNTPCSGTDAIAQEGNFSNGYNYMFETDGTVVNFTFELLDEDKTDVVAYLVQENPVEETLMSTENGLVFSQTINGFTEGEVISFACRFEYSDGIVVTDYLTYTVGSDCSDIDTEAPTNFTATIGEVTINSVELLLNAIDDSGLVNYDVTYDSNSNSIMGESGVEESLVITGLIPETTYSFSVIASDQSGNSNGIPMVLEATTLVSTDNQAPTDVAVVVGNITNSMIQLLLSANDDSGIVDYTVSYNSTTIVTNEESGVQKSLEIRDLSPETSYIFTIEISDPSGNRAVNSPLEVEASTNTDQILSVESQLLDESINIYPNPTNSLLQIDSPNETIVKVEIYDLIGNAVIVLNNAVSSINMKGLPSGLYLIKVHGENGYALRKVLKTN